MALNRLENIIKQGRDDKFLKRFGIEGKSDLADVLRTSMSFELRDMDDPKADNLLPVPNTEQTQTNI